MARSVLPPFPDRQNFMAFAAQPNGLFESEASVRALFPKIGLNDGLIRDFVMEAKIKFLARDLGGERLARHFLFHGERSAPALQRRQMRQEIADSVPCLRREHEKRASRPHDA